MQVTDLSVIGCLKFRPLTDGTGATVRQTLSANMIRVAGVLEVGASEADYYKGQATFLLYGERTEKSQSGGFGDKVLGGIS